MEKDYKEAIEKSTEAMNVLESKVESIANDFNKTSTDLWDSFKINFTDMNEKLKTASENFSKIGEETTLQAHLGAMEARDKMENMKEDIEDFTQKVAQNAQVTMDEATLQMHLGKKEAEDFWEKKAPFIKEDFQESKESVEKLALEAIDEIGSFFSKLTKEFKETKKD
ncbi:MAG: Unknown protein [uncultured Sulfurovum sp.]|uniref:Uncharacterized protein n=1 Tax=uncultured Sulfurovum sp. TaxID=269237 RepID=A0A6S6TT83_9BACT|nr:MAG: Unknown protein [uncultured Sulfurovum sp.]